MAQATQPKPEAPAPAPAKSAAGRCSGTAFPQHQREVTTQLSKVAPGVTVTQITDTEGNWISYHDIPVYSRPMNRIFFNRMNGNQKLMANPDGSDAQVLSSEPDFRPTRMHELYLSFDGTLAYYLKTVRGEEGVDIYAIHLTEPGRCEEVRLTNLHADPEKPVKLSTTTRDTKTHKNLIGFAESNVLHRILEDGTKLPDATLPDPQSDYPFHILRLNPRFPNILFYRRNPPGERFGTDSLWVVDLNNPGKAYDLARNYEKLAHPAWSPDGLQIGFRDRQGRWYVADVVHPDGTLNLDNGSFRTKNVGVRSGNLDAQFCSWSSDKSQFVCITSATGPDSQIFLMTPNGDGVKVLASTDLHERANPRERPRNFRAHPRKMAPQGEKNIQGDTWALFFMDNQHIIFHSTRTGRPELYEITNFTPF